VKNEWKRGVFFSLFLGGGRGLLAEANEWLQRVDGVVNTTFQEGNQYKGSSMV